MNSIQHVYANVSFTFTSILINILICKKKLSSYVLCLFGGISIFYEMEGRKLIRVSPVKDANVKPAAGQKNRFICMSLVITIEL